MRWVARIAAAGFFSLLYLLLAASADPVARFVRYHPLVWPRGMAPLRIVLLTDTHVSGPDTPPARLARAVRLVNAQHPDLVLLGGDFAADYKMLSWAYPIAEGVAPLGRLRARRAVIAVLGNHDYDYGADAVAAALTRLNVRVLRNQVVRVGPLAIGGVDDIVTGHARLDEVDRLLRRARGVPVVLSHSPQMWWALPKLFPLTLAGHTHCGQIAAPNYSRTLGLVSNDARYECGILWRQTKLTVTSAGIGTSILPFRLAAHPDFWVIDIGG